MIVPIDTALYYPSPDTPVARATFRILPDAPENIESELVFTDDHIGDMKVSNIVTFSGDSLPSGTEEGSIRVKHRVNGRVKVVVEVIILRADANDDEEVDVADAIWILSHLFNGGPPSPCPDSADANDDGQIDVADPIAILYTLFGSSDQIAAPYPARGSDPTPDALGPCYSAH